MHLVLHRKVVLLSKFLHDFLIEKEMLLGFNFVFLSTPMVCTIVHTQILESDFDRIKDETSAR